MAGPLIRAAAGAGAFVVIVTIGGSGIAVSAADPGGSSHSSHSPNDARSGAHSGEHRGPEARKAMPGPVGRDHRGGLRGRGSRPPTIASRTAPTISTAAADTASTSRASTDQATLGVVPPGALPELPAAVERGGSAARVSSSPPVVPTVTIGNGRSPGAAATTSDEVPVPVVAGPSTVLAPPIAPLRALPPPLPVPPVLRLESVSRVPVASYWGTLNPGWPAGALFGIAGLILAPIAGVWLGYRQARAAKAASRLVTS